MVAWGPGEWAAFLGTATALLTFLCGGVWFMATQTAAVSALRESVNGIDEKFDCLQESKEHAHRELHQRINLANQEHGKLKGRVGEINSRVYNLEGKRPPNRSSDSDSGIHGGGQ